MYTYHNNSVTNILTGEFRVVSHLHCLLQNGRETEVVRSCIYKEIIVISLDVKYKK
jgi:hypothetical protein